MPVIKVHSAIRDYDVNFSDTYDFMGAFEKIQNRFYVIDSNVWALYRDTQFSHLDPELVMVLPSWFPLARASKSLNVRS